MAAVINRNRGVFLPFIHSAKTSFPDNFYSQDQLIDQFRKIWKEKFHNFERIENFHKNVLVGGRHLALPLEDYPKKETFGQKNDAWIEVAVNLADKAVKGLLESAEIDPSEISMLTSTTVTGLAVPSLDARLMNRIEFKHDLKRVPLFGLGCLAGAAGINRVCDYLEGHPKEAAILVAVELCSLTVQLQDMSIANLVSSGLFGDGCAAVFMVGDEHPLAKKSKLRRIKEMSVFFPDTERMMGWDVIDTGFKVVLSSSVPDLVERELPGAVKRIKDLGQVSDRNIDFYISHPGGPKVLTAMESALGLSPDALELSWTGLKERGNMSSVSVLHVLEETLKRDISGLGLISAMGPAFCAEFSLVEVV